MTHNDRFHDIRFLDTKKKNVKILFRRVNGAWLCHLPTVGILKETKAEDGDAKEDKEGDKEGEPDEAATDSKEKDMRRLPPQGKEKTCGSPRVTLRIHQVKDKREKKNSVDHEPYNGNMESGKVADDSGSGKEASAVEESQSGAGGRSSPSDKEAGGPSADGNPPTDAPAEKPADGGTVAGVKRSHSTEDEASGGAVGEDGKKRRRKEDKVKSGSNSGGSPKSLVSIESEGEDAKSVESPGPKVPPLKIVISGASLEEPGSGGRNGKNGSGRHHLPYIVSAPPEAPDAAPAPPQTLPPADESKEDRGSGSGEEGGGQAAGAAGGPAAGGTAAGGRSHQRVLRSHRGKKGEGRSNKDKDKDKDSNSNSGSATSSPAGMGEVSSPRQVSPTPGAGSEIASEGEEKPAVGGTTSTVGARGERESTSGRDSDVEKTATPPPPPPQELHPRKRKIRPREAPPPSNGTNGSHVPPPSNGTNSSNSSIGSSGPGSDSGADASLGGSIGTSAALESITNSYQLFLNIRKQIERKRKGLFPVQPKPPQGFKDYLMNRCTYVLANNNSNRVPPPSNKPPPDLHAGIKELFLQQEKERHRLLMQHVIEKEKLVLSVEQEILRVHGRAARALANQALPFSACTILRDEEVYSAITPEQEEKDRNARSRYNGRLFLSWLQDVDDKWEKIKEAMLLRHHNEAESLHAVQKMDWEWKMKELGICEMKSSPVIDETHVPVVHVSDDFDLLPA